MTATGTGTNTAARARVARLMLAALAVVAVVPFRVLLSDDRYLIGAAVAVALVTAVSLALSPRRPLALSVLAATAVLGALGAVAVAAHGLAPGASLVGEVARLPAGWSALLTPPLPAAPTPAALALPVGLAAVAAFTAVELAARARWAVLGALAPAGLGVLALLYAGRNAAGSPVVVAVLLAGVLAVAALDRAHPTRWRPDGAAEPRAARLPVAAAGLAVVGGLACAVLGTSSPAATITRTDLHDRIEPTAAIVAVSPLLQASAVMAAPDDPVVFTLALDPPAGAPPGAVRLRVATLDDYDGIVWRSGGTYQRVGDLLPRRYPVPIDAPVVGQDITLTADYPGPYVPALARPVAIREPGRAGLRFDGASGDLAVTSAERAGFRYEVVSPADATTVPQYPTGDRLSSLVSLPRPVPAPLLALAGTVPAGSDRARIEALAGRLRDSPGGYDPQAPPGHSYPRLAELALMAPADGIAQAATIEQAPALLAVVARLLGLPSRVVVGYDVPGAAAGAGPVEVRAKQVRAWAEVHLDGEGWVAFPVDQQERRQPSGSPPRAITSTTMVEAGQAPGAATTVAPNPTPRDSGEDCEVADGDCAPPRPPGRRSWLAFALLLAPATPGLIVGAKAARRRRRRRRRHPSHRLAGAWQETVGHLRGHGIAVPPALTVTQLAAAGGAARGDAVATHLRRWAHLIDAAVYGAAEPDDDLADEAWNTNARLAEALRAASPRRRRLRAAFDPRPLRGHA